ncbi:hypothetical protein [Aeromonas enteropelogenes]|uniref:hypothetical protein n=1 Tax=Aeromonas enteropelogenes TaxID=29489 RepID=UPI003B9FFA32
MYEISEFFLIQIGLISFVSVVCICCIVKQRTVTEGGLIVLSIWFFFASPVTYYLASHGLDASELAQQMYFHGIWRDQYGDLNFKNETINSVFDKAVSLTGSIDKDKMYTYMWHNIIHGFFKIFVPLIWAAMGTWAMVRFLDCRIKVISNQSNQ